ncbi:hypothetical protein [Pseudonocardia sp. ICBG1293]|uniref:hypothetical protein n=1 Tax=Pseudonocardia sp. ICBG1293 TaxID=2844382 RepID=UPI001CCD8C5A|nr:hypothetical protein [Pseudonocardia sp. ICBG1293]
MAIENEAGNSERLEKVASARGHGLIGMRERASMLRGTLTAGHTTSGGFRVATSLPLDNRLSAGDVPPTAPDTAEREETGR